VFAAASFFIPAAQLTSLPFVAPPEEPVRVLFVGDIMLDRNVARAAAALGVPYLFASTSLLFADADVRVANLEGTVTNYPSIAQRDNTILRFTFDPAAAREVLSFLNLTAVSLANNHAYDFGTEGYAQTRSRAAEAGVAAFGHPNNATGELSTSIESGGKSFCFVGFHSLFVSTTTPVIKEIERLRPDCWRVVVFAHWGEEYQTRADASQQAAARAFIDAGADLVVGAHPHVVQNVEVYNGRAIFYSLGNFMFDQNFSWATTHGLAVRADFYKDRTAFFLTPTTIQDQKTGIAEGADRQKVLDAATVADFTLP
jgi:poly-gamma-glutamate synthesis protein (capsule biosynthesis protein)